MSKRWKHSPELFRRNAQELFNGLKFPTLIVSSQRNILWANEIALRLFSFSPSSPSNKCFTTLYGRQEPCEACPLDSPFAKDNAYPPARFGDITYLPIVLPFDDRGEFLILYYDITDIADQLHCQHFILHHLDIGIILLNQDFQIEYLSKGFMNLFPFVTLPALGKDLRLLISKHSPPFPKKLLDYLFRHLDKREKPVKRKLFEMHIPELKFIEVTFHTISDPSTHRIKNQILLFQDRTEENTIQRLQKQVEMQNELKRFFREIYLNLEADARELVRLSKEQLDSRNHESCSFQQKAVSLLNKIQAFRYYGEERNNKVVKIRLHELLHEIIKEIALQFSGDIKGKTIKVKKDFTRHILPIYGEIKTFRQILSTILTASFQSVMKRKNISKDYTPLIEIRTRMFREIVELQIRDNGPGFQKEEFDKIYASRLLLEGLGGKLEIQSVENVGTRITISIPTMPQEPLEKSHHLPKKNLEDTSKQEKKESFSPFSRVHIYVVGTKDYATDIIQKIIKNHGGKTSFLDRLETLSTYIQENSTPDCLVFNITREDEILSFIAFTNERNILETSIFLVPQELLPRFKAKLKDQPEWKILKKPFHPTAILESLTNCLSH